MYLKKVKFDNFFNILLIKNFFFTAKLKFFFVYKTINIEYSLNLKNIYYNNNFFINERRTSKYNRKTKSTSQYFIK